jgi:hypothetical protein
MKSEMQINLICRGFRQEGTLGVGIASPGKLAAIVLGFRVEVAHRAAGGDPANRIREVL